MTDFKKGRKSQSQKRASKARTMAKSLAIARSRDKVTHSTGFAFFAPRQFILDKTYQIGLFKFQPINPIIGNLGGAVDAFVNMEDYGKYAPFRFNLLSGVDNLREGLGTSYDRRRKIHRFGGRG